MHARVIVAVDPLSPNLAKLFRSQRSREEGMRTMWRGCFVFCVLALSAQVGTAQSSSGNIVTGEAKVEMISTYNGCEALAKPEKIMIQDFTPVGDIVVDESAA